MHAVIMADTEEGELFLELFDTSLIWGTRIITVTFDSFALTNVPELIKLFTVWNLDSEYSDHEVSLC